jgi:hypothetical protein
LIASPLLFSLVERRQNVVMRTAVASSAIVSSIFPEVVRDRLYQSHTVQKGKNNSGTFDAGGNIAAANASFNAEKKVHPKRLLQSMMQTNPLLMAVEGDDQERTAIPHGEFDLAKPIADLFTDCTVLFSDIVGFTAWSSQREPDQVFLLLQNVYQSFDAIARKLKVFKVETIGDCYVAVTGLPDPQKDHAARMTRFAREAMRRMDEVTSGLEIILGPDVSVSSFWAWKHRKRKLTTWILLLNRRLNYA